MAITLTPDQENWLRMRVAKGDFVSLEDAARRLLDERILERELEEADDLAWAKPFVDEAEADVARGAVASLDEHEARMDALLAGLSAR